MSTQLPKPEVNEEDIKKVLMEEKQKRNEPMLSRDSDLCGKVEIFAPFAPISTWQDLPWILKIERYLEEGPKRFKIKADQIMNAFYSPALIESHKYEYKEPEGEEGP